MDSRFIPGWVNKKQNNKNFTWIPGNPHGILTDSRSNLRKSSHSSFIKLMQGLDQLMYITTQNQLGKLML